MDSFAYGDAGESDGDGDGNGNAEGTETDAGADETEGTPESCDPWLQDCPVGEKCVPYSTEPGEPIDANKCVPVLGTGQPGDACSSAGYVEATDDCGADSFCWNATWLEEAGLVGTCTAFCQGTVAQPSCTAGTTCVMNTGHQLNLCVEGCNPIAQDCNMEPHDQIGCYVIGEEFVCAQTTLDIPLGEPCNYVNDCAPGGVCVPAAALPSCAGEACCTAVCDADADGQCGELPGTECTPLFEPGQAPFGFGDVGTCQAPT